MVKAYVLIKTESGKEDQVLKEILGLTVTEEAHEVFGPYDIIAEVRARDMDSIVDVVVTRIRKIQGITDTHSLIAIDAELDVTSTSLAT